MGVIKQGILGGFSGKVANVVGSSWKGIAVIKSRPLSVANPKTAAQTGQRTKFSAAVAFAVTLLTSIVKPFWDRFAQLQSGYNAFIQANIYNFSSAGVPNYPNLIISRGSLLGQTITSIVSANGNDAVDVTFIDNSGAGNALATDEAYAVVWNETQDVIGVSTGIDTRGDGQVSLNMPTDCVTADVLHAYLAFRKADGTLVSPTDYATDNV
jgi:hypothetical protein